MPDSRPLKGWQCEFRGFARLDMEIEPCPVLDIAEERGGATLWEYSDVRNLVPPQMLIFNMRIWPIIKALVGTLTHTRTQAVQQKRHRT